MEESTILNKRSRTKGRSQNGKKKLKKDIPKTKKPENDNSDILEYVNSIPFKDEESYNEYRKKVF